MVTDQEIEAELEETRLYCETCEDEIGPTNHDYYQITHWTSEGKDRDAVCLCSKECLAQYP